MRTITVPALVAVELRRHLPDRPEGISFQGLRGAPTLRRDQFHSSARRPALKAAGMCERCQAEGLTVVPAAVLDRVLAPVSPACHEGEAAGE